jgi:large subunit ribosomal protein L6
MSKIGEKPVQVDPSLQITIDKKKIIIKGAAGEINFVIPQNIEIQQVDQNLLIKRTAEDKKTKSNHGLLRALISNAVSGLSKPWERRLEIVGTGYTVKLEGENLVFKVGYSHPVVFKKIPGVTFGIEGNNKIILAGADKHLVGQTAYKIKMIRKPDVYKGKGIKYEGEKLRIKPGKKAKTIG